MSEIIRPRTESRKKAGFGQPSGLLVLVAVICIGCGGGHVSTPPSAPQALSITVQPLTQGVRLGQAATFSVTASGSAPISYQWSKNGVAISGAMESSYITPATSAGDNDSVFTVAITNPAGSVTSGVARLLLNTPQANDLRFQQVDAVSTRDGYNGSSGTAIGSGTAMGFQGYGSPFYVAPFSSCAADASPRDCEWFFSLFNPTSGFTTRYQSGLLSNFGNDLTALSFNTVITSIDREPLNNAYAISTATSTSGTVFSPVTSQSVLLSDLQATASEQGSLGRVVTAVGLNAGVVSYVSYGMQNDSNVYEVSVANATIDNMSTQAAALAQQGYIITAVGGNVTDGFLLVGTRVQGDTMPRPFKALSSPGDDVTGQLWGQGYAIIAIVENADGSIFTWLGEK